MTHIDRLSPVLEWNPPYEWPAGTSEKERHIAEAVAYHRAIFRSFQVQVIPVCTDVEHDRVFGVDEWLVPAMLCLLDEAQACALLGSLQTAVSRQQLRLLVRQLARAGWLALEAYTIRAPAR